MRGTNININARYKWRSSNYKATRKSQLQYEFHPKKEGNEDVCCQFEPWLPKLWIDFTSPVFILSEHVLEALKGLASNCLHSMESMHDVGLDMGVLERPTKTLNLLALCFLNTFEG
jgi:hypothetical protein